MMDYPYWIGVSIYAVCSLLLLVLVWVALARLASFRLRWILLWTFGVILFFPWFSEELPGHFAPSIIVAGFALLDTGFMPALNIMQWPGLVWLGGSIVIGVIGWVVSPRKQPEQS